MITVLSTQLLTRIAALIRTVTPYMQPAKIPASTNTHLNHISEAANSAFAALYTEITLLRKEVSHAQAILETMSEAVIAIDCHTNILTINSTAEKILGIAKQNAQGKFFLEAIRNNDLYDIVQIVLTQKKSLSREILFVQPEQKNFIVNATFLAEGGCLLVLHDITQLRRLETIRTDFVANISHELKTPLTSIRGFIETLQDGALHDTAAAEKFLSIIHEQTLRLNSLTEDLLGLAHLESRELALDIKKIHLAELIGNILSGCSVALHKKNLTYASAIDANLTLNGDLSLIRSALANLIDNAVKFNKENGWIRITAVALPRNSIKITVEDSGVGIPQKDITRIFERFYRVDKARSRELGGTGLGLAIVKHAIEIHGGMVGCESTENNGSTFWFTLPRKKSEI